MENLLKTLLLLLVPYTRKEYHLHGVWTNQYQHFLNYQVNENGKNKLLLMTAGVSEKLLSFPKGVVVSYDLSAAI